MLLCLCGMLYRILPLRRSQSSGLLQVRSALKSELVAQIALKSGAGCT